MRKITDEELINFFNNLKEIIQAQKELNHVLHKRIGNLETRIEQLKRTEESFATDWIDAERGNDVV